MPLSATATTSAGSSAINRSDRAKSTSKVVRSRAFTPTMRAPASQRAVDLLLVVRLHDGGEPQLAGEFHEVA